MVDISIAGRRYAVQCDDGQESRLKRLASYIDHKAADLQRRQPELTEPRTLLLAGLLVTDELFDAYEEIQQLRTRVAEGGKANEAQAAKAMENVAARLEQLAASLQST
jgi:cell division protein ZapA